VNDFEIDGVTACDPIPTPASCSPFCVKDRSNCPGTPHCTPSSVYAPKDQKHSNSSATLTYDTVRHHRQLHREPNPLR
jgi:hypothetical protein